MRQSTKNNTQYQGLQLLFYRAALPLSSRTLSFTAGVILASLTALLSAGSLIASPGLAGHVPSVWRWPVGLIAVARSIYSHLPPGGTPLWLGFKDVGTANPAAALAALA